MEEKQTQQAEKLVNKLGEVIFEAAREGLDPGTITFALLESSLITAAPAGISLFQIEEFFRISYPAKQREWEEYRAMQSLLREIGGEKEKCKTCSQRNSCVLINNDRERC